MIQFTILGEPCGKGRPRATTINGHARMYTPSKTRSYESRVIDAYVAAGGTKMDGFISIQIEAIFAMPMSWSMKKRKATDGTFCGKKPDGDNVLKIIGDALNGIAYTDDSIIAISKVVKRWGQDGMVNVFLQQV